jgi:hypothetical protein
MSLWYGGHVAGIEAKIWWDIPRHRLNFRMAGFWTEAILKQWEQDTREAMKSAPRVPWSFIGDLSDYPAQDEHIVEARRSLVELLITNGCTSGAYITPKAIIRMQSQRMATMLDPARFGFFSTRQEAEAFLTRVSQAKVE